MANDSLDSGAERCESTARFNARNPVGDMAMMFVNMDRQDRLTTTERETLRKHADNAIESLPIMIRAVAVALMDAANEGDVERSSIANALWSIDHMADALQGMHILASDLRAPAGMPNHG